MFKGFKEFITRGNVVDMAVGIVIGAAFGQVVSSFTESFLQPLVTMWTGGEENGGKFTVGGVDFPYGMFLDKVIAFLLTAFAVYYFVVVPMNSWAKRRAKEEVAEPSDEVRLLTEIRDGLARRSG